VAQANSSTKSGLHDLKTLVGAASCQIVGPEVIKIRIK